MLSNAIIMNFASSSLLQNKLHHMSMPEQFSVIMIQKTFCCMKKALNIFLYFGVGNISNF